MFGVYGGVVYSCEQGCRANRSTLFVKPARVGTFLTMSIPTRAGLIKGRGSARTAILIDERLKAFLPERLLTEHVLSKKQ